MIGPRKIALQLTPLLDLLLIVIFAQYMEVRQETRREQIASASRLEEADRERRRVGDAAATLRRELAEARRGRVEADKRAGDLSSENEALRQRQAELAEALTLAAGQRDVVGALTAELFDVPPDLLEQALAAPAGSQRSEGEMARLRQRFDELAQMRSSEVVKHLLTYDELRKRADVWDVYLAENGLITFETGEQTRTFRAATSEAFASNLYQIYKSLPQPKGLVIVLLSFGDAPAVWREAAQDGLRRAADRMREDAGGRTRFEYAVLGFRPRA